MLHSIQSYIWFNQESGNRQITEIWTLKQSKTLWTSTRLKITRNQSMEFSDVYHLITSQTTQHLSVQMQSKVKSVLFNKIQLARLATLNINRKECTWWKLQHTNMSQKRAKTSCKSLENFVRKLAWRLSLPRNLWTFKIVPTAVLFLGVMVLILIPN